jgi:SPP1 family predicted phage head-tail adaptor
MSLPSKNASSGDPIGLAARLKHRVVIQQRVLSADGAGGSTESWSSVATVWAELRARSGSERSFAGKLETRATHALTMRYRSGITSDMRVSYGGRQFNIRRIDNVNEAGVLLELQLEEGVAQ